MRLRSSWWGVGRSTFNNLAAVVSFGSSTDKKMQRIFGRATQWDSKGISFGKRETKEKEQRERRGGNEEDVRHVGA